VFHYDIDISKEKRAGNGTPSNEGDRKPGSPTGSHHSDDSNEMATNLERFIKKFAPKIVEKFIEDQKATLFQGARYVYDGFKNLYTVKYLDMKGQNQLTFKTQIEVDGRPADFIVKLKLADKMDMKEVVDYYQHRKEDLSERALSIYEIVFRFIMGNHYETFQRKFFDLSTASSARNVQLAQFVQGFTSAVRMTEFGLALNLHLKTSCVISSEITKLTDLAALIANIRPGTKPTRNQLSDFNKFIRHLRVFTQHTKGKQITYTMDQAVDRSPRDMQFKNREGALTNIAEYFQNEYSMQLQQLPLIKTTGKMARYLPMELCYLVPNQFLSNAKINAQIQRELLFKSTHTPNVYFNRLDSVVKKVAALEPELQRDFGIGLDTKPVAFTGRVLPTPRQLNGDNRGKFHTVKAPPAKWAVFSFDPAFNKDELTGFVKTMVDRARYFGLNLAPPSPVASMQIKDVQDIYNVFHNLQSRTQAQFVFVGIPTRKF
jgi:hypothetical protein